MKNPYFNLVGYIAIIGGFSVFVGLFYLFVFVVNKPIDAHARIAAPGLTAEENAVRKKVWYESTQEAIHRGAQVYSLSCTHCHGETQNNILERVKSGQLVYGGKPFDLFRTITKGMEGQHRFDYLLENDRWALVHYLRSLNPQLPQSQPAEFRKYLKEGI